MASLLCQLGAVRAQVQEDGVASWWKSRAEAEKAKVKFSDMGLRHAEVFEEKNGLWAVMAMSPIALVKKERLKQRRIVAARN